MNSSEYLLQLLKDRQQLSVFPNNFIHIGRLLDTEINRVRNNAFYVGLNSGPLQLPDPLGPSVTLMEKITVPVKDYPDFNFVGRLLGPRGLTTKQLELDTGCKILIRGQGSMRDKQKEMQMKGKTKWEHLNEDLHVLVLVEDSKNRATIKMNRAIDEINKLLKPVPESEDELKKRQLTELAMLNGTYKGLAGSILAKSSELSRGVLMSPPPSLILSSPNPSQIFVGPLFHGPMTPSAPLTPLSSSGILPSPLMYHHPVTDVNFMFQIDPSGIIDDSAYEYEPIQNTICNTAFAH